MPRLACHMTQSLGFLNYGKLFFALIITSFNLELNKMQW